VYDAERAWKPFGQTLTNAGLQPYVDKVLATRAVQSRWGQRHIRVELTRGGARAVGNSIRLGVRTRNEAIILHEVAHCLTPGRYAAHGPEFVGVLRFLVQTMFSATDRRALDESLRKYRVRWNARAVPAPDPERVVTKAAHVARKRARTATPVTPLERRTAADIIRRAAAQGLFGPAGRKPRVHALATARALEAAA